MKKVTIIVKREVQRVGYRDAVEKIARKLKLVGYVENLKPYDVKIVAESEEGTLKKFVELIKIKKYPIDVDNVVVTFEEPKGEFEYFEIKRGEWQDELGERMDVAGSYLYKSVVLGEKSVELGEKSVKLGERSVKLSERSVELGEKSVAIGERTLNLGEKSVAIGEKMLEKQDQTIDMIREGNEKLTGKLDLIHKDMSEKQDKTIEILTETKKDLSGKLSNIHNDLSVNLKSFHQDTIARFDVVDKKYGKIAENIEKAVCAINRTCENTEKLLEKSDRDREDYKKSMKDLVGAIVKLAEKK